MASCTITFALCVIVAVIFVFLSVEISPLFIGSKFANETFIAEETLRVKTFPHLPITHLIEDQYLKFQYQRQELYQQQIRDQIQHIQAQKVQKNIGSSSVGPECIEYESHQYYSVPVHQLNKKPQAAAQQETITTNPVDDAQYQEQLRLQRQYQQVIDEYNRKYTQQQYCEEQRLQQDSYGRERIISQLEEEARRDRTQALDQEAILLQQQVEAAAAAAAATVTAAEAAANSQSQQHVVHLTSDTFVTTKHIDVDIVIEDKHNPSIPLDYILEHPDTETPHDLHYGKH